MARRHILITGGAGFIGSHLADELLRDGHRVRALDSLAPQVHGAVGERPSYLDPEVELRMGDVRDAEAVRSALEGVDAVYHLAATVGVGQSMYELARYTAVNSVGTAVLLEALVERPVERLVVASSMSVYGEGLYCAPDGRLVGAAQRPLEQLRARDWELRGPRGETLVPVADARGQAADALVRLCAQQVRPGAAVPDGGAGLRHPQRGAALLQRLRHHGRRCRTPTPECWRSSAHAT